MIKSCMLETLMAPGSGRDSLPKLIQVTTLMPAKVSSFLEASISLRRRQRKCGSPARAAT